MTYAATVVSDWSGVEPVDGATLARKLALPSEDGDDSQVIFLLQQAFGRNVRAARQKAGLTQVDLADRSGISRVDISRIEGGQINVTLRTMSRLASVFDLPVAAMLVEGDGN